MLFLVVLELLQSFSPCGFVGIPAKTNIVQGLYPSTRHVSMLAMLLQCVMTSLFLHPERQLGIIGVLMRNVHVAVGLFELLQLCKMRIPSSLLGVPGKIQLIQHVNATLIDTGLLAIQKEFVLLALFGDPTREFGVGLVSAWDDRVSKAFLVFLQLIQHDEPAYVLGTSAGCDNNARG